jgi:antitoxin component of MazEF toxin-antitoxin module
MALIRRPLNIGGSRGVIIPKAFLAQLAIDERADAVEMALDGDRIVVVPHRPTTVATKRRRRPRLKA